jgi:hypothetical protein
LKILQQLKPDDNVKRAIFCVEIMENISIYDDFLSNVVFSFGATFHLSRTANRHNVRIWGLENRHETTENVRDTPTVIK